MSAMPGNLRISRNDIDTKMAAESQNSYNGMNRVHGRCTSMVHEEPRQHKDMTTSAGSQDETMEPQRIRKAHDKMIQSEELLHYSRKVGKMYQVRNFRRLIGNDAEECGQMNTKEMPLANAPLTAAGLGNVVKPITQISYVLSSSLFRTFSVFLLFVFITSNLDMSNALTQSKCETYGWNAFPVWKYRARARYVPALKMEQSMQQEFFSLFRGVDRDSSEEDSDEVPYIPELTYISEMCPKDAFFYSLSPKHIEAAAALAKMFVAQPSPPDVLRLAKLILRTRQINPKVWYHGIVGAAQERPDMTGFKLAHALDAMPDIFIPGPLLFDAMRQHGYRSGIGRIGIDSANSSSIINPKSKNEKEKKRTRKQKPKHRVKRSSKITQLVEAMSEIITETLEKIDIGEMIKNATVNIVDDNTLSKDESESRGMSQTKRAKERSKKDHPHDADDEIVKKKKKKRKHTVHDIFKGNGTYFVADDGMWKKARTDDLFEGCGIVVDGSVGVKNGIENALWYFREDMMVNQHHWYWHQEYPLNSSMSRPRRAELFFFMHHNLIARYNAERISNGMPLVKPFDIRPGAEIKTPYNSYLADVNSGKFWTPRPHGVRVSDIIHMDDPDFERNIMIGYYNTLYGRIYRSIEVGHLLLKNSIKTLPIRNTKGIEPLANTMEASGLSVNPTFYDMMGFHNLGHQVIGLATDPKFIRKLPTGVMADTSTTMRDPAFYSYHTLVDDLFDKYKRSLPPYKPKGGEYPLRWDGVEVLNVQVLSKSGGPVNQMRTFWSTRKFELTPGVDQSIHKGDLDVDVCAVHLNHEPFDFKITVALDPCAKTKLNKATVRIFLAPKFDEHGHKIPLHIQRRLMIKMDTFPADLRVGRNVLYRRSYDSSVVKPWSKSLKEYENAPKYQAAADFCGCGWPTHLYIPKGSHKGTLFDVFVMLTNFDEDVVEEDPERPYIPEPCNSPYIMCGVPWRKYPDAKPMGFPFDRLPFSVPIKCPPGPIISSILCRIMRFFWYKPVSSLDEYVSYAPNMAATVVEIKHFDHLTW